MKIVLTSDEYITAKELAASYLYNVIDNDQANNVDIGGDEWCNHEAEEMLKIALNHLFGSGWEVE